MEVKGHAPKGHNEADLIAFSFTSIKISLDWELALIAQLLK